MTQAQFGNPDGKNALKVMISGSYKVTGTGEIADFEDVEIIMPLVEEEFAVAAARKRYAYTAIKAAKDKEGEALYKKSIDHIRQVHIDDMQEIEYSFAYVGKGIKQMDDEDIQNLAVEKGLRELPLPRRQSGVSMREMRQKAYTVYSKRILSYEIDMNDKSQNNYAKWTDIIPHPLQKAAPVKQKTAEEVFDAKPKKKKKVKVTSLADELSRLRGIASANGIDLSWDVELDEAQEALQGAGIEF